jgi:methylglutaconyl-CoA hydratase
MSNEVIEQGSVKTEIANGIGRIHFYHPKSNSLPGKLLKQLAGAITAAGNNDDIKVLILESEGEKAFCAGASFDELLSIDNFATGKEFFMGFARVINAARKCPKLIIGRVQGKAVGGGVGLVSATDYALAHHSASIKLSELAIGIGPFVVGPAVKRKTNTRAFNTMAIDTKWRDAQWAKENGMYVDVFQTHEELDNEVNTLAERLAKSNPEAMMFLKEAMWHGTEDWEYLLEKRAEMSGKLVLSEFTSNAINQFKQGAR